MKNQFLRQVAQVFKTDHLEDYTFVFPNRRSSLFFLKYLGEMKDEPFFSPRVFTVDELFDYLSDLEVVDDLTLVFRLWKSYSLLQKEYQMKAGVKESEVKVETIDDFISWGRIILSDFTDIDQYMVDARQLLMNVRDIGKLKSDASILSERQLQALKKISNLKENIGEKKVVGKYLEIWDMLLPLYNAFRDSLYKDKTAYSAMMYRDVAQKLKTLSSYPELEDRLGKLGKVAFVGFSAPSECEKVLMRYFRKKGGLFYWDFYSRMLKARHNLSSRLISKCAEEFVNTQKPLEDNGGVEEGKCRYNLVPSSGATEQAMIASKILDITQSNGAEDIETAIVVSDETLLLPLLEMLNRNTINVTMGYPLKASSMASLAFSLSDLNLRSRRSGDSLLVPGEVLISILSHPYVKDIDPKAASKAISYLQKSNLYMLDASELEASSSLGIDYPSPLPRLLEKMTPKENMFASDGREDVSSAITDYFLRICEELEGYLSSLDRSFLNKFREIVERVSSSGIEFRMERSVYSVLRSAIKTASVSFKGEPLAGLQVMGNLETRALDFERIIFLSFNEGTYPASGEKSSCIPFFLRKAFNLPTYENENSISAYNFYRLIQRAKDVYFIYDTASTDKLKSKEESRFVKQLKYDFEVDLNKMDFEFPLPSSSSPSSSRTVLTDKDRQRLANFFSDLNKDHEKGPRGFSASSLNDYLDCQRKFYFSKVMGIKEDEELSDTVEANTFGSIFHYCMEHIYDGFSGGKGKRLSVNEEVMSRLKERVLEDGFLDRLIAEAFKSEMKVRRIEGQNLIIKKSIETYIRKALEADCAKAESPYDLVGNEVEVSASLDETFHNACFTGKIDRLEEYVNIPRICDYKTGKFLVIDRKKGLLQTLESKGFQPSGRAIPYLPVKDLSESEFEALLDGMFDAEKHRDKYHCIMFQLFVYAFLHKQKFKTESGAYLSVYQLPIIKKCGPVSVRISDGQLNRFSGRLASLLKTIREKAENEGSSVEACRQVKGNCDYCDFNKYCRRSYGEEK